MALPHEHDHSPGEGHAEVHPAGPGAGVPGGGVPVMTDPAQQALVSALHASFNVLRVLMIVLVVLYLMSGWFRVAPGEQGLIARLGVLRTTTTERGESPVFPPGLHWSLPDPFDRKIRVSGTTQTLVSTRFLPGQDKQAATKPLAELVGPTADLNPGQDGAMLTGDRNLSHGRWTVEYQIRDAAAFVQRVGERPEQFNPLLERLLETAVVREVAGRTIEQVTREALEDVRSGVRRRLQAALDRLETGVEVKQVVAETIEPGPVRDAFLDVTRAVSEAQRLRDEAEEKATEALSAAAGDRETARQLLAQIDEYGAAQLRGAPAEELRAKKAAIDAALAALEERGKGEVAVRLSAARGVASAINQGLRREYEQYRRYVELRKVQPRIAALGLWVAMRQEILGNRNNEVFFVPQANEIEILVNRDPQRAIERETEAALRRQRGETPR